MLFLANFFGLIMKKSSLRAEFVAPKDAIVAYVVGVLLTFSLYLCEHWLPFPWLGWLYRLNDWFTASAASLLAVAPWIIAGLLCFLVCFVKIPRLTQAEAADTLKLLTTFVVTWKEVLKPWQLKKRICEETKGTPRTIYLSANAGRWILIKVVSAALGTITGALLVLALLTKLQSKNDSGPILHMAVASIFVSYFFALCMTKTIPDLLRNQLESRLLKKRAVDDASLENTGT